MCFSPHHPWKHHQKPPGPNSDLNHPKYKICGGLPKLRSKPRVLNIRHNPGSPKPRMCLHFWEAYGLVPRSNSGENSTAFLVARPQQMFHQLPSAVKFTERRRATGDRERDLEGSTYCSNIIVFSIFFGLNLHSLASKEDMVYGRCFTSTDGTRIFENHYRNKGTILLPTQRKTHGEFCQGSVEVKAKRPTAKKKLKLRRRSCERKQP